jgi:hypothetical protein
MRWPSSADLSCARRIALQRQATLKWPSDLQAAISSYRRCLRRAVQACNDTRCGAFHSSSLAHYQLTGLRGTSTLVAATPHPRKCSSSAASTRAPVAGGRLRIKHLRSTGKRASIKFQRGTHSLLVRTKMHSTPMSTYFTYG